jgi:hypothetical protein
MANLAASGCASTPIEWNIIMTQPVNLLIAESVNKVIRQCFPVDYCSLCHAHAIVGSNVISVTLQRNFRPVAGLAVIDCGGGTFIRLMDNSAFDNAAGGAFHCWIESTDDAPTQREVVDLTFRHNKDYAAKNKIPWKKKNTPDFLWGRRDSIVVKADRNAIPDNFTSRPIWLHETTEGANWITRHLADNMDAYVTLTTMTLNLLKQRNPKLQFAT